MQAWIDWLTYICLLFSGFSNVYHFTCVWPTALKLGCITNFAMLLLVIGFIYLVDEIQFMLISSHHICIKVYSNDIFCVVIDKSSFYREKTLECDHTKWQQLQLNTFELYNFCRTWNIGMKGVTNNSLACSPVHGSSTKDQTIWMKLGTSETCEETHIRNNTLHTTVQ